MIAGAAAESSTPENGLESPARQTAPILDAGPLTIISHVPRKRLRVTSPACKLDSDIMNVARDLAELKK